MFGFFKRRKAPAPAHDTNHQEVRLLNRPTPLEQRRFRATCLCTAQFEVTGVREQDLAGFFGTLQVRTRCPACHRTFLIPARQCRVDEVT